MFLLFKREENVIQRYPLLEYQRKARPGFSLMKTTGTCTTARDEEEEYYSDNVR